MTTPAHFALEEFLHSDTALAQNIGNHPSWQAVANLQRLAATMEQVRALLGNKPVTINSGFRCPALNAAVGGVSDSAHLDGLACDFVVEGYGSPLEVCKALEPYVVVLEIDQLIDDGGWTHLGLSVGEARHQTLTLTAGGGYAQGFG